jgi:hypothetical protein
VKPPADEEDILTGSEAFEKMTDTWKDISQGKVDIKAIGKWLIVRRNGGDYSMFISLVDDTVVMILENDATTRHIPTKYRPEEDTTDEVELMLRDAFDGQGTGSYPLSDEEAFGVGFKTDDGYKRLEVSVTSDEVRINDDP